MELSCILIPIALKFDAKDPIDTISALLQVMFWCWTGIRPLSKLMMTKIHDAIWGQC